MRNTARRATAPEGFDAPTTAGPRGRAPECDPAVVTAEGVGGGIEVSCRGTFSDESVRGAATSVLTF